MFLSQSFVTGLCADLEPVADVDPELIAAGGDELQLCNLSRGAVSLPAEPLLLMTPTVEPLLSINFGELVLGYIVTKKPVNFDKHLPILVKNLKSLADAPLVL